MPLQFILELFFSLLMAEKPKTKIQFCLLFGTVAKLHTHAKERT